MSQKTPNTDEINVYEQLEILALHSVSTGKDASYTYRKICRWFSKEFNTSLPQVTNLPVEFVLQNYYEAQFEVLKEEDLFNMMRHHSDTEYVEDIESSDDEFMKMIEEEEEAKQLKLDKKQKEKTSEKQSYSETLSSENSMKFEGLNENNER